MEDTWKVTIPITITRETYDIWERVFSDRVEAKFETEASNPPKKQKNIEDHNIPEQDIQECFEVGLRVLDVLSPNFLKIKKELRWEYEKRLTMLKFPRGYPPF